MIVFDLKCSAHHVFEAWFGSSSDYEDQRRRGLIACPVCGDASIDKAVMAPAVGAKSNQKGSGPAPAAPQTTRENGPADPAALRAMMTAMASAQAKALENSEWVGRAFAEKARAMHYGETERDSIHGEVAPIEAKALLEEGVPVAPLLFPVVPPEAKN